MEALNGHHPPSFQDVALLKPTIHAVTGCGDSLRAILTLKLQGFLRHPSGVPRHLENLRSLGKFSSPGETEPGSAGTQPDKGYPGRRCAHGTAGPWRKSLLGAALLRGRGTPQPS